MSRRSLIITAAASAVVLASALVIWYLYSGGGRSFFGRGQVPLPLAPREVSRNGPVPVSPEPLLAITSRRAYFSVIAAEENEVRYLTEDGILERTGLHARNETRLAAAGVPGRIQKISWSPDGGQAVVWSGEEGKRKVSLLEISTGAVRALFSDLTEVAFAPDTKNFLALGHNAEQGETFIQRFQADGKNPQTLLTLPQIDPLLAWVNRDSALLWERVSARSPSTLFRFDLKNRSLSVLKQELVMSGLVISPKGDLVLLSAAGEKGGPSELLIMGIDGKEVARVPVSTLASKCTFYRNGQAFICGVPESRAGAPGDRLVRFDISTKTLTDIDVGGATLDIFEPRLSPDERYLIFMNQKDGWLWSLAL